MENNTSDIARFVQSEVDRLISKRLLLDGKASPNFKRKMIETLIDGAQGMFRWVEMSLEALKRIKFLPDFKRALGQLPSELSGLYDIIYAQIDQTETHGRDVAVQTLKWLLCAQRLLSAEELVAAVYKVDEDMSSDSDEGSESENEQLQSPENDILRLCRNLVVFDSEQAIFRFAHQSVREYLLKRPHYTATEQHALVTERCLDVYLTDSLHGSIARKMERQNDALKPYAEVYWPVHYKNVGKHRSNELETRISRFTGGVEGRSLPYVQWISDIRCKYGDLRGWNVNKRLGLDWDDRLGYRILVAASRPDTLLAAASAFGILSFFEGPELSLTDWNQCQTLKNAKFSLLSIAAREGHYHLARLLLDKGAHVNARDRYHENALAAASYEGHDHIVQLLLDNGAEINSQSEDYGNALQAASSKGHGHTVLLLLDQGADVNTQGTSNEPALQVASSEGHDNIVHVLLDRGADVNAQGGYYGSALQAASHTGHDGIVRELLDRGADVNAQCGRYWNALQAASRRGHERIVRMLLDRGADVDGHTLRAASSGSHDHIVQLLLVYV